LKQKCGELKCGNSHILGEEMHAILFSSQQNSCISLNYAVSQEFESPSKYFSSSWNKAYFEDVVEKSSVQKP